MVVSGKSCRTDGTWEPMAAASALLASESRIVQSLERSNLSIWLCDVFPLSAFSDDLVGHCMHGGVHVEHLISITSYYFILLHYFPCLVDFFSISCFHFYTIFISSTVFFLSQNSFKEKKRRRKNPYITSPQTTTEIQKQQS